MKKLPLAAGLEFVRIRWLLLMRKKGIFLRSVLCWSIGCLLLTADEVTSYDLRLQIRGEQKVASQIVIVQFKTSELASLFKNYNSAYDANFVDFANDQDASYWNQDLWHKLLKNILQQNPQNIGVSFYFGDQIGNLSMTPEDSEIFRHPKVIWASQSSSMDRFNLPIFAISNLENVGNIDFPRDEDGVIRRISTVKTLVPHLAEKLARKKIDLKSQNLIHFRGGKGLFTTYNSKAVLDGRVARDAFKNKIVIIGAENQLLQTPLGGIPKSEVIAQVTDNVLLSRWILRGNNIIYFSYLFTIMLLSLVIMKQYPQSIALTMLFILFSALTTVSIWVFDSFYIWLPIISVGIQIGATWIIFVGYQASKIERKAWLLQQEQSYRQELEQLKNNFVSLISHDLKTPIAKIQGVIDRRMALSLNKGAPDDLFTDLKSIKEYSEELNRYIQSILKVMRVESSAFSLNKEIGDINELIEQAIDQLMPLALQKQITIISELEPLFSIEADLNLIKEVVINLLDNAIKYSPNNEKIIVRTFEKDNFVVVEVADNGSGISKEESEQVWKKFVRGKDQDLKTKGTGLGLYLVKYFVELHGGNVYMKNNENKPGITVGFTLPIDEQQEVKQLPDNQQEVNL